VTAIAAGATHSLALHDDGHVTAWGNNGYGQTTPPRDLSNVVAVAAGDDHSLAPGDDGRMTAWGPTDPGRPPFRTDCRM